MRLLTPEQCAEQLSVSRSTVLRLISDGNLPAVCLKRGPRKEVWRVREEVLTKWVLGKEKEQRINTSPTNEPSGGEIKSANSHAHDCRQVPCANYFKVSMELLNA